MAKQHFAGKQYQKLRQSSVNLTADDLTKLSNVDATATEIDLLDGATQGSAIADLAITYTTNDPGTTPNSAITIADGDSISNAEIAEMFDEIEGKINAIIAALEGFGVIAT